MGQRGQHGRHADSAHADDRDGVTRLRSARVEHRAPTGKHGATQERRHDRGHVGIDGDHRPPVDDGVRGERGHPEVVQHACAVAVQPDVAVEQRARRVGGAAG